MDLIFINLLTGSEIKIILSTIRTKLWSERATLGIFSDLTLHTDDGDNLCRFIL